MICILLPYTLMSFQDCSESIPIFMGLCNRHQFPSIYPKLAKFLYNARKIISIYTYIFPYVYILNLLLINLEFRLSSTYNFSFIISRSPAKDVANYHTNTYTYKRTDCNN